MEQNQSNIGLNDALSFISNIASVLNQRQNNKRSHDFDSEPTPRKQIRVDEAPIVNAAQTLVSAEPQQSSQLTRDELNDFKKQMQQMQQLQTDFIATQSNMFRMMNPYAMQSQQPIHPQIQNGMNCYIPSQQPMIQSQAWAQMQAQPNQSTSQHIQSNLSQNNLPQNSLPQNSLSQNQLDQNQIQDHQGNIKSIQSEQASQDSTVQASKTVSEKQTDSIQSTQPKPPVIKTTESTLIEAGMSINESEHLINELFKQFIETNFSVKSNSNRK